MKLTVTMTLFFKKIVALIVLYYEVHSVNIATGDVFKFFITSQYFSVVMR